MVKLDINKCVSTFVWYRYQRHRENNGQCMNMNASPKWILQIFTYITWKIVAPAGAKCLSQPLPPVGNHFVNYWRACALFNILYFSKNLMFICDNFFFSLEPTKAQCMQANANVKIRICNIHSVNKKMIEFGIDTHQNIESWFRTCIIFFSFVEIYYIKII